MDAAESECSGACVPGAVCSVRELAAASEWQRAADRISRGNSYCCRQCLEWVVQTAVQHQQWDCVVRLSQRCTLQQKSEVVRALAAHGQWSEALQLIKPSVTSETVSAVVEQAVKEGQWSEALQLIKPSVTSETVSAVVEQAVKEGQWGWIREVVKTGLYCGQQQVEWLCQHAVDRQQWDTVMQLLDIGVQSALRNAILQSAVVQRHVPCTAKLIELGVRKPYREEGIRNEMAKGHGDFVLQVVKTVQDPDLTDFVLQESMKQNQWHLALELVKNKEGLCVNQMENVCDTAVACKQWSVALQLLHDGVSPSNWIVDEFFQSNMIQALVDLYPAGCVTDGLKGLLLMGSIRHGQGDFFVHLLQRESVSDEELMDAMMHAVHLLDKGTLLKIIRASSRCRRVFKQKFVHQNWKDSLQPLESEYDGEDGGEAFWLFDVFYEEGEKDLALHVAANSTSDRYLIFEFCQREKHNFDLNKKKFRYALRKLHECDTSVYADFVETLYMRHETSEADRSFLFLQAVRLELYDVVQSFCEHGVSKEDLKFFVQWFFQIDADKSIFSQICCTVGKHRNWLKRFAVRCSMKEFFKQKTDKCLNNFIDQYVSCYNKKFLCQIFRKAVGKCVKFDCANCFVELCKKQFSTYSYSLSGTAREDCIFAYTSAVTGNRPHFISKVCKEKMGKACNSAVDEFKLLIDIVFEKKVWSVLPGVSAGFNPQRDVNFQLLAYCLQKMLTDQATWPGVAPALVQWLSKTNIGNVMRGVRCTRETLQEQLPTSLARLKAWCVDSGHANLAFLLALVIWDWQLIERLVNTQPSLDLHQSVLHGGVEVACNEGAFSTGATILKLCPVNTGSLRCVCSRHELAVACGDEGLVDWALTLNRSNWTYVQEHHRQCQNPLVLNSLLQTASFHKKWDITRELLTRCTDSKTLQRVFHDVVKEGEVDLAEALSSRVNPCSFVSRYHRNTLLCSVVTSSYESEEVRLRMICLCIASGVSSFERNVYFEKDELTGKHNSALLLAVERHQLDIPKLIIASGACSNRTLHKARKSYCRLRPQRREMMYGSEKAAYSCILEAAATPARLEHLARLAMSHSIGCQPGREERIQNLPVPELVRDLLRFRDVLTSDAEKQS